VSRSTQIWLDSLILSATYKLCLLYVAIKATLITNDDYAKNCLPFCATLDSASFPVSPSPVVVTAGAGFHHLDLRVPSKGKGHWEIPFFRL
jgi:hypothetical protein